jgi:hypothetical protein
LDFGIKNNFIYAPDGINQRKIMVDWQNIIQTKEKESTRQNLTLGF